MRILKPFFFLLLVVQLGGCTTIRWHDPKHPDKPVFSYTSGRDIEASGLLVIVEYHENGSLKLIHVEIGNVAGKSSEIVESITTGVIDGLKIGAGVP